MPCFAHNSAVVGRPDLDTHVAPRSLYLTQLRERLGEAAVRNIAAPGQNA